MSIMYVTPTSFMQHHGIQGQSWGVQNGPPYPLDKETSKAVSNGFNGIAGILERHDNEKRKKKENEYRKEASKKTDQELNEFNKRKSAERQYAALKMDTYKTGKEKTIRILKDIGDVAKTAASIATVSYLGYKAYKDGMFGFIGLHP